MKSISSALAVLFLLAAATDASATPSSHNWRPADRTARSANNKFLLEIHPSKKTIDVFATENWAVRVWSLSFDVWSDDCLITDDGETLITLFNQERRQRDKDVPALRFWNRDGEFKQHMLSDLVEDLRFRESVGNRTWTSYTPWFRSRSIQNGELLVTTIDGVTRRFSLTTGAQIPLDAPGGNRPDLVRLQWAPILVATAIGAIPLAIVGVVLLFRGHRRGESRIGKIH